MKKFMSVVFLSLVISGCWMWEPPVAQECQSDIDCKGPRVCDDGECVSLNSDPSGGNESTGSVNSDTTCGSVQIKCNCEYVDAYDGEVFPTTVCDSQYVMVTTYGCEQNCYSPTWQAICYC